ncbi:MAG: twin-arginine translocation pathway signal protein [Pseudomonadota bacterium]
MALSLSRRALVAFAVSALMIQTTGAQAESGAEIDQKVDAAIEQLYAAEPQAKDLAAKSVAMLIFPEIIKGGLIVGGQYGEGALRVGGETKGYFSIAAASFGLQFGGQTFGYAMFFLNQDAVDHVRETKGFEVGTGPTLVGGDQGWSGSLGTNDLQGDIAVVFFGQEGLMAGGGIQGSKITRIER